MGLFTILFEEVGFQMFLEDGQGLCCPSFRGKLVPPLVCQVPGPRRAWTGLSGSCPSVGMGGPRDQRWQNEVLGMGCRVSALQVFDTLYEAATWSIVYSYYVIYSQ